MEDLILTLAQIEEHTSEASKEEILKLVLSDLQERKAISIWSPLFDGESVLA